MRYAISACLMGENCKYSGGNNRDGELVQFMQNKEYILVCPEVEGGLPIPRASCEIIGDKVINAFGEDWSEPYQKGAAICLQRVLDFQADLVVLQPRSPSCGLGYIYDGTFHKQLIKGNGVFAKALNDKKIKAVTLNQFKEQTLKRMK